MPRLEATRLTADWLAGTLKDYQNRDRGANTFLQLVPLLGGETRPPNLLVVEDETRHPSAARGRGSSQSPGLVVRLNRPIDEDPTARTTFTDAEVDLLVDVCLRDVDTPEAMRDGLVYARAVIASLRDFARNENAAKRDLHQVHLTQLVGIQDQPSFAPLEDVVVTNAVFARWKTRDHTPMLGAPL